MKPTPLPGISQRPQWPTPTPRPATAMPQALTLRLQVLDTDDAKREARRIAGQLDLLTEVRTDNQP